MSIQHEFGGSKELTDEFANSGGMKSLNTTYFNLVRKQGNFERIVSKNNVIEREAANIDSVLNQNGL